MKEKERKEGRSINVWRKGCVLYRGTITDFYEDFLLEISKKILQTYSSVLTVSIDNLLLKPYYTREIQ